MRTSESTLGKYTGRTHQRHTRGTPESTTREHYERALWEGTSIGYTESTLGGQTRDTPKEHTGGTQGEHTRDTPGEYAGRVHREGLQSGEGAAAVAVDAEAEGFVEADVTYILGFPEGREGIEH